MRAILSQRPLRFVFAANLISMLGSGMNSAAVAWYILQATHSEQALGTLAVLQTIPAMLMLPFTGVIIDREDRRRLVMWLDAVRAVIIASVAILAFRHRVQVWELYLMNTLVAAGFWMFWPTITALIQELTPEDRFVHSNTFLLAGVQGGWLIAGSVVGFMYNHIGLGGVLVIDVSTYVVSFLCYFAVRKGRHVVPGPQELRADLVAAENQLQRFWRDLGEGLHFLRDHRAAVMLGISWALFLGAMMTGGVVTPSLSERVFHAGPVGYGWLSAGWGTGAFFQRALRAAGHCRPGWPPRPGVLDGVAFSGYDLCAGLGISGSGHSGILRHGFGARSRWSGHEYQPDGNGPQTLNGTRAEHLLFCGDVPANRARPQRGCGGAPGESGGRIRDPGLRVRPVVRGRELAGGYTEVVRERKSPCCG